MALPVTAFIGIGSNLGNKSDNVEKALLHINHLPHTRQSGQSNLFRTAPLQADGEDYINAVVRIETQLTAQQLLQELQGVEQLLGRERPYLNAPRTLDLDLLLYGRQQFASPSLTVPHPRITERAFVLIPLLQIDPLIDIPGKGPAHHFVVTVANQKIQPL